MVQCEFDGTFEQYPPWKHTDIYANQAISMQGHFEEPVLIWGNYLSNSYRVFRRWFKALLRVKYLSRTVALFKIRRRFLMNWVFGCNHAQRLRTLLEKICEFWEFLKVMQRPGLRASDSDDDLSSTFPVVTWSFALSSESQIFRDSGSNFSLMSPL